MVGKQRSFLVLSIVVAVLMVFLSLAGLIWPDYFYPTRALRENFLPNDLVTLCLGHPLFIYIWTRLKPQLLVGWLLLPGVLIFVIYNYLAYVLVRPLDRITALGIFLVTMSVYPLVRLFSVLDHSRIKNQLESEIPTK